MTERTDSYVLQGGTKGAERLQLLTRVMWPTTRALIQRLDLRPGMHCLDVGCGIGAVTLRLAKRVGTAARTVGIDADEACLVLARHEAARLGLSSLFRVEKIADLQEEAAYDLVYSRFLLTHLADPQEALERMVRAARPGGLVVVEDIEFAAHFSFPSCPALDRYVHWYQLAVQNKGGDPNIGPRLPGLFMNTCLKQVGLEVVQPTFRRGLGKRIAQITMEHIRESVLAAGLAARAEVDNTIAELAQFARNPRTILSLPRIFQVWGRRPIA